MDGLSVDSKLNEIFMEEKKLLKNMLELLERQHTYLLKQDVFKMEDVAEKIEKAAANIAKVEINRRNIADAEKLKDIVYKNNNTELLNNYRELKKIVSQLTTQKDTNEVLIKQGLYFTGRMLKILNPARNNSNLYNAKGKLR